MARAFKRRLGTIPFTAGSVESLELPRNHVYRALMIELTGDVVIAGGTAAGTLWDEQPQSLFRDIRIIRNGGEQLLSVDGGSLGVITELDTEAAITRTAIADDSVATHPIVVRLPIFFSAEKMARPSMSLLRAVGTSSLVLEVSWGTQSGVTGQLWRNGDATSVTFSNMVCTVYGLEIMDIAGRFADKLLHTISRTVTAADTRFTIPIPPGPLYRRIFLKCTDEGGQNVRTGIVSDVSLLLDGTVHLVDLLDFDVLGSFNTHMLNNPNGMPVGYSLIDFAEDGNPAGLIVTAGVSSFDLLLNVVTGTNVTEITVITESFVPAQA